MTGTTVYTIGHGARTLDDFLATLRAAGVAGVIDVRRYPGSRRHPHFGGEALAAACKQAGIAYDPLASLGGRRKAGPLPSPNPAWTVDAFRHYADFMDSAEFAEGLARLLALAALRPSAVMCAETHPSQCHRRLIADKLVTLGHPVVHLITPQRREPHVCPPFLRLDGEHLRYDRAVPPAGQAKLF
ncbi:MAG TPA: DUF488 domain-containing protein [Casimicrobiaceae bacterium]